LMAILKTVAYGWDQAQLSHKAQEIHELGRELHKRASTFLERFLKVGDRIEALSTSYEDTRLALSGRQGMVPQLRKFEEYGCKSEKQLPAFGHLESELNTENFESQIPTGLFSNALEQPKQEKRVSRSKKTTEPTVSIAEL
jgi:DNA anti-recombination protein RmuC